LCDPAKRKTYDSKRKAKEIHLKRRHDADAKTKKFRDDLEERERQHKRQKQQNQENIELQKEINRLREEGLRKIHEEKERHEQEALEVRIKSKKSN